MNQEVKIGDWISTVPKGLRSVEVGKVIGFTKTGNPIYRVTSKSVNKYVGSTVEYKRESYNPPKFGKRYDGTEFEYFRHIKYHKPHFIKVQPTKELELFYENN